MHSYRILSTLMAVLSLSMLLSKGVIDLDLSSPLRLVFEYYDKGVNFLFSLFEPYLIQALDTALGWFGLEFVVFSHWRHVALMLWLYAGADAVNALKGDWTGHRTTALFRAVWGTLIAVCAGIASGMVALDGSESAVWIAAFPAAGLVLYRIGWAVRYAIERQSENKGYSWVLDLRDKLGVAAAFAVAGGAAIALSAYMASWGTIENPGLAALFVLIITLALLHLGLGAYNTRKTRKEGETWRSAFLRQGSTRQGLRIVDVIIGVIALLLTNAGLSMAGL